MCKEKILEKQMKGWGNDEVEEKTNGVGEIRWSWSFLFLGLKWLPDISSQMKRNLEICRERYRFKDIFY